MAAFIFSFAEHHKHVRKTRGLLDAIQPNANRLCLPQRGKIVAAKAEQRSQDEVETIFGDSQYDQRTTGAEERAICKSTE